MPLLDGEHVVAVSFADPFGNKAEQSFKFYIDNAPPVVRSFSPEQDQTVSGPRPTFVLECEDQGIDLSSVNIIMSPLEAPGTTFRDHIIKNGKYTFTSFTEPKFRKGQPVGGKRVVFTSKRDLTVKGRYLLDFDFTDNRGLHAKNRRWVFRIE